MKKCNKRGIKHKGAAPKMSKPLLRGNLPKAYESVNYVHNYGHKTCMRSKIRSLAQKTILLKDVFINSLAAPYRSRLLKAFFIVSKDHPKKKIRAIAKRAFRSVRKIEARGNVVFVARS